jgi:hypothetical protein
VWMGRTVRGDRADHPQAQGRPSKNATRTSSTAPSITDRLRPTRGPSMRRRPSALASPTVRQTSSHQKCLTKRIDYEHARTRDELDELPAKRLLADRLPGTCGLSAWCADSSPSSNPRSQLLLPIHGSPKRLELSRKHLGEM